MGSDPNKAFFAIVLVATGVLAAFGQAQVPASGDPVQVDRTVQSLGSYSPPGRVETGPYGIAFVSIPAGTFQMGSNDVEPDEKPVHTVRITKPL